ncbi:MAG: hypothetical protein IIA02_10810 [Proteobacteria bacterium]|nr:hypothetical protein [Pseudomonadota bacterium]
MTTINVMYIGTKSRKEDNIAGSGLAWRGHGDVQPVTAAQWAQLSKHPDIWVCADDVSPANTQPQHQPMVIAGVIAPAAPAAPAAPVASTAPASTAPATAALQDEQTQQPIATLLGSDVLGSIIDVGGEPVQLGTVVAAAHQASGLSIEDWNGLVPQIRETLLANQVAAMRDARSTAGANGDVGAGDQDLAPEAKAPAQRQRRSTTKPVGEVS